MSGNWEDKLLDLQEKCGAENRPNDSEGHIHPTFVKIFGLDPCTHFRFTEAFDYEIFKVFV